MKILLTAFFFSLTGIVFAQDTSAIAFERFIKKGLPDEDRLEWLQYTEAYRMPEEIDSLKPIIEDKSESAIIRFHAFKYVMFPGYALKPLIKVLTDLDDDINLHGMLVSYISNNWVAMTQSGLTPEEQEEILNGIRGLAANSPNQELAQLCSQAVVLIERELRFAEFKKTLQPKPKAGAFDKAMIIVRDEGDDPLFRSMVLNFLAGSAHHLQRNHKLPMSKLKDLFFLAAEISHNKDVSLASAGRNSAYKVRAIRTQIFQTDVFPMPRRANSYADALALASDQTDDEVFRASSWGFFCTKLFHMTRGQFITKDQLFEAYLKNEELKKDPNEMIRTVADTSSASIREARMYLVKSEFYPNPKTDSTVTEIIDLIRDQNEDIELRAEVLDYVGQKFSMMSRFGGLSESDNNQIMNTLQWATTSDDFLHIENVDEILMRIIDTKFQVFKSQLYPNPKDSLTIDWCIAEIKNSEELALYRAKCLDFLTKKSTMMIKYNAITTEQLDQVIDLTVEAMNWSDSSMAATSNQRIDDLIKARFDIFKFTIYPKPASETSFDDGIRLIKDQSLFNRYRVLIIEFLGDKTNMMTRYGAVTEEQKEKLNQALQQLEKDRDKLIAKSAKKARTMVLSGAIGGVPAPE